MAIRGVSLAEKDRVILKSDLAHPDNIKAEVQKRLNGDDANQEQLDKLKADIEAEVGKPTIWIFSPLTVDDRIELGDLDSTMSTTNSGAMQMTMKNTERAYLTVQRALVGWENFEDGKGKPIPFKTETAMIKGQPRTVASKASLNAIDKDTIFEMSRHVSEQNGMRGSLEKKLDGLSTPQVEMVSETSDATAENAPQTNESNGDAA